MLSNHKWRGKVITTMAIMPLDNPTWCAQSAVTDLWPSVLGMSESGMSSFVSPPMYSYQLPIDTYGSISNRLAAILKGDFLTPQFGG